ncbi:Exportin 7 [Podila epigama]|nr:Exportin 7 [Podila epigama]
MSASVDITTLEQFCHTLYNPPNSESRVEAAKFLDYHCPTFNSASGHNAEHVPNITSPIQSALLCRRLLENSTSPYATMFATSRLKTLVEDHFTTFTTAEQLGLRSFVLQHIYQHPESQPFVLAAQAQLFAIITKLGWLANEEFRPLVEHMQVFFQHDERRTVGIKLLTAVATEMNLQRSRNAPKNRKAAVGFRDAQMLPIFQCGLNMLRSLLQSNAADSKSEKLKDSILALMRECLAFDFIGALPDESSDENGSIQAPTSWRAVFEEQGYLGALWQCFQTSGYPVSVRAMECLSQAASIRRSIFSTEDARNVYIQRMMQEIIVILTTDMGQQKLQDASNFHQFCRMLSCFNNTFQLTEICERKEFERWISAIGEFTSRGFHAWKWSPNSVPYLLSFWSKVASSIASTSQRSGEYIMAVTVDITRAYLASRLECVRAVMDGEVDDPLESEEELIASLEKFARIARVKYADSGRILLTKFEEVSKRHQGLIQQASSLAGSSVGAPGSTDITEQLMVIEIQLTWMVYILAACIGAREPYQSTSVEDQMDGEMTCEILGFIHNLQVWVSQRPPYLASADAHLYVQSAILYFYTQFRSSYISEDSSKTTKVYTLLSERWGINAPSQFLDVIVNSSLGNLRSSGNPEWKDQEDQLVIRTIKLYTDLASGYTSVKHIRKLDSTKALLKNHCSSDFRFLAPAKRPSNTAVARARMNYYTMLSRVLFAEENFDADFWRFVKPWDTLLKQVLLTFQGKGFMGKEDIRLLLLGIFKDLRGFVISITNRKQYIMFFEWFFTAYAPLAQQAIDIWCQDELGIAILRFWLEFVTNKSSRITFDSSSPDGILLFRETSKILSTFGQSLLRGPASGLGSQWKERYKGIMLYFNIMSVSLSGKYANFGVFKLYGDKALDNVLEIFFQLMLATPLDDIMSFQKLSQAYFSVLDVFAADHMMGLSTMPPAVLGFIFQSLGEIVSIQSADSNCSTLACSAIDKIFTFVFNWCVKNEARNDDNDTDADSGMMASSSSLNGGGGSLGHDRQATHWLVTYVMSNNGDIMSYLLSTIFQVVAFENRSNHWSLSRPLLALILLNQGYFIEYTTSLVHAQLYDHQMALMKAVEEIMDGIEVNLSSQNRDRFTTKITAFRRECAQMTLMPVATKRSTMFV